jgi:hypothetical protein
LVEVERSDGDVSEDDVEAAVGMSGSDDDLFVDQGFGHSEASILEGDTTVGVDQPDDVGGGVIEGLNDRTEGARAGAIAIGRHGEVQGIVRSMVIMLMAPGIEGLLGLVEIGEAAALEQPATDLADASWRRSCGRPTPDCPGAPPAPPLPSPHPSAVASDAADAIVRSALPSRARHTGSASGTAFWR